MREYNGAFSTEYERSLSLSLNFSFFFPEEQVPFLVTIFLIIENPLPRGIPLDIVILVFRKSHSSCLRLSVLRSSSKL